MAWDHGYNTTTPYTSHFYREMCPSWIDFACLIKGFKSPRRGTGSSFNYLELGCGTGLGLCQLAALYPEGHFVGVDFIAEHIVHARDLADKLDLGNIEFVEADLLEVADDFSTLEACGLSPFSCHYVACHGLLSWVSPEVRHAILSVANTSLRPEGVLYGSYNTLPGWQGLANFQHLVSLELRRGDENSPAAALERASSTLTSLLGTEDSPSALSRAHPALSKTLKNTSNQQSNYLIQEYANENWNPFYVSEAHALCSSHKFRYLSTASLPDLFEGFMPEPIRSVLLAETNPTHRQSLLDLATNRRFRRDLFSRGAPKLMKVDLNERLKEIKVRLKIATPQQKYAFRVDYGEVIGTYEIYSGVEATLANGPQDLATIADVIDQPIGIVVQAVAFLIHADRLGLDRGEAALPVTEGHRINTILLNEITRGAPYSHLIAPSIGTAVGISRLEARLLRAHLQNPEVPSLETSEPMGLRALNAVLDSEDGETSQSDDARRKTMLKAKRFKEKILPNLQALGIVPPAGVSSKG